MKKIIHLAFCLFLFTGCFQSIVLAQDNVGIGTLTPLPSSILDLNATDKGLLIPRMTTLQRNAISNPATGLLVYDITTNGFWYFNGIIWVQAMGLQGPTGANGLDGVTGIQGVDGPQGVTGSSGQDGAAGATGATGADGQNGATGATGVDGQDGADGATGATGDTGANGSAGANGATGATGVAGPTGLTGATGPSGQDGAAGATGAMGATGLIGVTGADGNTGATGPSGQDGATGGTGAVGGTGATGANGTNASIPSGVILMWSGALANIPAGFALCDGNNGTPNLMDRFVVSVPNSGTNPGATGGAHTYSLAYSQMPSHSHTGSGTTSTNGDHTHYQAGYNLVGGGGPIPFYNWANPSTASNVDQTGSAGSHNHTYSFTTSTEGSGAAIDNRPLYYAVAFIMKL